MEKVRTATEAGGREGKRRCNVLSPIENGEGEGRALIRLGEIRQCNGYGKPGNWFSLP